MNQQPEITTKRLVLRQFIPADGAEVQRLAGNYNVSKTTLNIPYPYPPGEAEAWISTHKDQWNSGTSVIYAIAS